MRTATSALASYALAIGESRLGEFTAAQADFRHALQWAPIGDAAAYRLGNMQLAANDAQSAYATLANFKADYPHSPYLQAAELTCARAAARLAHWPDVLSQTSSADTAPFMLLRAQAYEGLSETADAVRLYRDLYVEHPEAPEAATAALGLQRLGIAPSWREERTRGTILLAGGRARDAADAFARALSGAPTIERDALSLAEAHALLNSGQEDAATAALASVSSSGRNSPEALYLQMRLARHSGDLQAIETDLATLARTAPDSRWYGEALRQAAIEATLTNDLPLAEAHEESFVAAFPRDPAAPSEAWRAAWNRYRSATTASPLRFDSLDSAAAEIERYLRDYPRADDRADALYWRGRLAEIQGRPALALACYRADARQFPLTFFGQLASERAAAGRGLVAAKSPLRRVSMPRSAPARRSRRDTSTAANAAEDLPEYLRFEPRSHPPQHRLPESAAVLATRARIFEGGWLLDDSATMLRAAIARSALKPTPLSLARRLADVEIERNHYDAAIDAMLHAYPGIYRFDLSSVPRADWQRLFPFPFRPEISRLSRRYGLSPFLVAGLIRQESGFDPHSVSHAHAVGLMQLLVSTANIHRHAEHLRPVGARDLEQPGLNLELGTAELDSEIRHYQGHVEYALAGYNAGDSRVRAWLLSDTDGGLPEFVETIPFTETRQYVQIVLRNERMYRLLYGSPQRAAHATGRRMGE
jgi:soluble lytic murein transglycosylase